MNCREAQERLVDLFDAMPPPIATDLASHLADCANCAREYAAIQAAVAVIQPPSCVEASPDFKERVMHKLTEVETTRRSRWFSIPRLAFIGAGALLLVTVLVTPHRQSPALSLLAQSAEAMSNLQSVHISARMRTLPGDNFEQIDPALEWAPLEIWKDFSTPAKWRVEKPGRIAVMDGVSSVLFIKPDHAVRAGRRNGFLEWLNALLDTGKIMENELAMARAQQSSARLAEEGHTQVLTVQRVLSGNYANDWMLNKTVTDSNHTRVYRFDRASKRLEGMQVVLHAKTGDVAVFEITGVRYNESLDPALFSLTLPQDVVWSVPPEEMPAAGTLPQSAKEAATAFFDGLAREDWNQVLTVYRATAVSPNLKQMYGGLEVISIGEPFQSGLYRGWFVPYRIRFKSGEAKQWKLAVRNDNPAHRWVVDGGF